jgi:hypothetical protein
VVNDKDYTNDGDDDNDDDGYGDDKDRSLVTVEIKDGDRE